MSLGTIISLVSLIWFASEIVLARLLRAGSADRQRDAGSIRIIWIVIVASVSAGIFFSSRGFGHIGGETTIFPIAGIVVIIAGVVLRWVAILTLKRQFTVNVAIREDHRLVTHGIYRYLRHPSYTGSLLSFLGLGLAFGNIVSLIVVVAPICAAFVYRIRIEEQVLLDNFGADYQSYCDSTWRLVPLLY